MTEQDVMDALAEACSRAGTQTALSNKVGISQSTIADYLRGRCSIGNMTVSTLFKLFPDITINFFGGKSDNDVSNELRIQLLEIFDGLDDRGKVKMLSMAAANFGEHIRQGTK